MPVRGAWGNAQNFGRLIAREPCKVAQFDQLRLECLYSYSTMGDPEIITRKDEFLQRRDADRPTTPAAGNGVR